MNILVGNRTSFGKPFLENNLPIEYVLTSKGSPLDAFAKKNGIELGIYRSKFEFLGMLEDINFKFLFSSGCPFIIPENILNTKDKFFINVHPSLLPLYPGPHAITEALYSGGPFGITVHTMGVKVDSGRLIYQEALEIMETTQTTQKFIEIFQFEEKVISKCINFGLLFRDSSYSKKLPKIYPENTGFVRNIAFRKLNCELSMEEAKKRILALSVKGHMSFIETEAKRYYISDYVHARDDSYDFEQHRTISFEFSNGKVGLVVSYHEDIE